MNQTRGSQSKIENIKQLILHTVNNTEGNIKTKMKHMML